MTRLKLKEEIDKSLLVGPKISIDYTLARSERLFEYDETLLGGIFRESCFVAPEVWVYLLPHFNRYSIRGLLPFIRIAAEHYGYLRARTELTNEKAARFAFACGFMWEETVGDYNFFSVRG